jgi:hypothetical protein
MEEHMVEYKRRYGWALVLAVVLLSAVAGAIAYNVGVSDGIAQSAAAQGTPIPAYAYGWHRPWGFGFGFPVLFFVVLWFVLLRGLWWGGPWGRHRYYYAGPHGIPPAFDEWHRRAHEHMNEGQPAVDPGRRG